MILLKITGGNESLISFVVVVQATNFLLEGIRRQVHEHVDVDLIVYSNGHINYIVVAQILQLTNLLVQETRQQTVSLRSPRSIASTGCS